MILYLLPFKGGKVECRGGKGWIGELGEGEGEQEGMGGMEGKESVRTHKLFQRYVGRV